MKLHKSLFLAAIITLLLISNASAQMFEGMIMMEITSPKFDKPMTMTISTKGDHSMFVMQMPQGNINLYIDKASQKITMVMAAMNMGMEMPMTKPDKSTAGAAPKVEEIGDKQMINGHSCELYRVTAQNGNQSNWWVTDDLPKSLLNSMKGVYNNSGSAMRSTKGSAPGSEAIEAMFNKGLMPIRVEMLKDGKPATTMTFVKYEQKHLDDSVFIVPSDIKIQQMPAGMGGMGGQ